MSDIYIYQNRIYISGFQGDYDDDDVLVLGYNTAGDLISKTFWGGSADDSSWGITVRNPSEIVIVGRTSSYATGFEADAFISKYFTAGAPSGDDDDNGDDDDSDDDDESTIPFGNTYLIFTFIAIFSLIVIMKRKAILKK